jgi:hypothetical protein
LDITVGSESEGLLRATTRISALAQFCFAQSRFGEIFCCHFPVARTLG